MTHQQWQAVEQTLAGLSMGKGHEVVGHVLKSIRTQEFATDRGCRQREAFDRLCQTVEILPTAEPGDA